ncbi:hypothetical protein [Methylogaea oryzae]|uniref:Uncharacterized protein n=1 Tax=Methylogaea oryzae TaxID=1295382 RepID=A0A8D4VR95_9GAMM|nr:hypothetical protein [Methylogaea oryzae]BBL70945.1 hypothetical protein MoryE10_15510 [Methylogaea oryzae]
MISAIGSSTFPYPAPKTPSPAYLDSQLKKYEAQLADWVGCPSCKTPEGKAKIAEISDQISAVKRQIQSVSSNSPVSAENNPAAAAAPPGDSHRQATDANDGIYNDSASYPGRRPNAVGGLLDVYA